MPRPRPSARARRLTHRARLAERRARRDQRRGHPRGARPEAAYLAPDEPLRSPLPRLAWRYRSELAPGYLGLAVLAAGVALHAWAPGWWPIVLAVGVAAGLLLGQIGQRIGLDREAERAYAGGVTALGALWLAVAGWYGPFTRPLPLLWAGGILLGGVPWW